LADSVRVLIVDDHQVLGEGVALILSRRTGLEVVGVVGSVEEAVHSATATRPRVVLLDYHLPDGTGADAAAEIRRVLPDTAIVMLRFDTDDSTLLAAVEAGVAGFLSKEVSANELVAAIRRVANGEVLIPAARLAGCIARQRERAERDSQTEAIARRLSPREQDVLRLMALGYDSRAIAAELTVSLPTVRSHVQNILQKLDAHSKLEAVAKVNQYGLLASQMREPD